MILVEERPELVAVTQPDHARLGAELLALWRRDGLPEHPRREELLVACREHDNGWREADAAPRCDAAGRPYDFVRIPAELRIEIWERATARYERQRPYVALLVTHHALVLHRTYGERPGFAEFLARLAEREAELCAATGLDAAEVAADYRFLDLSDNLSLALCSRRGSVECQGVRARVTSTGTIHTLSLDPFPLAAPSTLKLPYRRIRNRPFRGDADLGTELAQARWQDATVEVMP